MELHTSIPNLITLLTLISLSSTLPIDSAKQSICTEIPTERITLEWKINNAKTLFEASTDDLWSPPFYTRNNTDEWRIQFVPSTNQWPTYFTVYLHLIQSEMLEMQVKADFYFLTTSNSVLESNSLASKYNQGEGRGFKWIADRSSMLKKLPDNDLIIRCKLAVMSNATVVPCQNSNEWSPDMNEGKLTEDFRHLLQNMNLSDITLLVGNETIPAHKAVLAARSPVFGAIFEEADKNETDTLIIEDMAPIEVRGLLEFVYTDEVSNLNELDYGLLRAADVYQLPRLKAMCEKAIYDSLDEFNAADILIFTHLYHSHDLKKHTLDYIVDHLNGVTKSEGYMKIMGMHPVLLNEIVQAAAQRT